MTQDQKGFATFASMVSAMGGGEDFDNVFPKSDAEDVQNGAEWIPAKVTEERQRGNKVGFVQNGESDTWYWELPDGNKIFHRDRYK
jgi:hypothetical protein